MIEPRVSTRSRKLLYTECRRCGSRMGPVRFLGELIRFGRCPNDSCPVNIPFLAIIMGPPHMSAVDLCTSVGCCDGRPWWWPGSHLSGHLS